MTLDWGMGPKKRGHFAATEWLIVSYTFCQNFNLLAFLVQPQSGFLRKWGGGATAPQGGGVKKKSKSSSPEYQTR